MMAERKSRRSLSSLGDLLRYWRAERGKSQLDLALDCGVSQRHISFVEGGRSIPSRQVLLQMADGLGVPLRDRNALLNAAGYAALYADSSLDAPEMASIAKGLRRVMRQHEPFPAIVMDRYWNVIMSNDAAPAFFGSFVDMASRPKPRNLLHLMFDPDGMRPFIANWDVVAGGLLARVHREAVGRVIDERTEELIAALLRYSGEDSAAYSRCAGASPLLPMLPIDFVKDGQTLSYFSLITTVGTPQTIAAEELRMECMYAADDETEVRHIDLMDKLGGS